MKRPSPDIEPIDREAFEAEWLRRRRRFLWRGLLAMVAGLAALWLVITLALLLIGAARADTPAASHPADAEPVTIGAIIDGDTVKLAGGEVVRLSNIDAPEMGARARCEAEAALGLRARAELARLIAAALHTGQPITLQRCERREHQPLAAWRCVDIYGRTLGRLFIAGEDTGEALIRAGLATRWPQRFDGCGFRR